MAVQYTGHMIQTETYNNDTALVEVLFPSYVRTLSSIFIKNEKLLKLK